MEIREISTEDTYALRHAVLWPDRPLEYVKLEQDETGRHFGAFVEDRLVSVISLFFEEDDAHFRKFATDSLCQGKGIGSALLSHAIEAAKKAGARTIWCDARSSALSFYQRFGMEAEGDVFFKGGLPYLVMRRIL
jgi:GNAT superfamily N-acetyltransferase